MAAGSHRKHLFGPLFGPPWVGWVDVGSPPAAVVALGRREAVAAASTCAAMCDVMSVCAIASLHLRHGCCCILSNLAVHHLEQHAASEGL